MCRRMRNTCLTLLVALLATEACGFRFDVDKMTTNDVDAVFSEIDMDPRSSLWKTCTKAGLRELEGNQIGLRQYVFDKLLAVPIETNMWWCFSIRFDQKYSLIRETVDVLGERVTDTHFRKMLLNAESTFPVSTNGFTELRRKAVQLDREKEPWRLRYGYSGNPGRNLSRWRATYRLVIEWNQAVATYRRRLVELVCRRYEKLHMDVPEKERHEALKELLQEYGFPLPDLKSLTMKNGDDDDKYGNIEFLIPDTPVSGR